MGLGLCCACGLLAGCGSVPKEPEPQPAGQVWEDDDPESALDTLEEPFARAYYDFLLEYISGEAVDAAQDRFCLLFIDDDAIPELIIFQDKVRIYTYHEGQIIDLGEYEQSATYGERSGVIVDHIAMQDGEHSYLYKIENGERKEIGNFLSGGVYNEGKYTPFFEVNGVSVQREVYEAEWNELAGIQESVFRKRHLLKEDELLATLVQAIEQDVLLPLAIEEKLWKRDCEPVMEQVAALSEVLESYGEFLAENAHKSEAFTLIYLDNDEVPELVIMDDGWHLAGAEIYAYEQGETVYAGRYGQFGRTAYLEKKGIIFNPFSQGGSISCGVYEINGAEDVLLQVFDQDPDLSAGGWDAWDECSYIYKVDDRVVSEEQYEEAWQKWDSPDKRNLGYDYCIPVEGTDIPAALEERLQTLILTRYDTLRENVLLKSGLGEEAILLMDYDDYDGDGIYEAFVFCGESDDYSTGDIYYSGNFWFVGVDQCIRLPERYGNGSGYRKIDGLMTLGASQKYLYYYSDYNFTANISGIWTVKNGKPVEVNLPQTGQVVYRGEYNEFELWADGYDHYYEPDGDLWTGHTWRPYFYHYDWQTGQPVPDEGEDLSPKELEEICGFDLAGEVEAEGYEVTAIVRWQPSDIVTINYTIPLDEEDPLPQITYENIIWDCEAKDYWRSREWGVTSWRNAGVGGSI